jgi:hypothetical protein
MKMVINIDSYFDQATHLPESIKPLGHLDQFNVSGRIFRLTKDMTSQISVMLAYKEIRDRLHKEGIIFTPFAVWSCDHVQNSDNYTKSYTATGVYAEVIETGERTLIYLISPEFKYSPNQDLNYSDLDNSMLLAGQKYYGFVRKPDLSNNPHTALKLRAQIKSAQEGVDDEAINKLVQVFDSKDCQGNPVEIWFIQNQTLIVGDTQKFLDRLNIKYKFENPFD